MKLQGVIGLDTCLSPDVGNEILGVINDADDAGVRKKLPVTNSIGYTDYILTSTSEVK